MDKKSAFIGAIISLVVTAVIAVAVVLILKWTKTPEKPNPTPDPGPHPTNETTVASTSDSTESSTAAPEPQTEYEDNQEAEMNEAKINEAIRKAETEIKNYNFDEASKLISVAYAEFRDDRLRQELDRIDSLKGVSLADMVTLSGKYDFKGKQTINTGDTVSVLGVTCTKDIEKKSEVRGKIAYATQGRYRSLNCRLGCKNDRTKDCPLECFIEVLDDGVSIYKSAHFKKGSLPVDISVDISNVQKLEIVFVVVNPNDYDWLTSMWSLEKYYSVNYLIYDAFFYPEITE